MSVLTAWWPSAVLAGLLAALWLAHRAIRSGWLGLKLPINTGERSLAVVEVVALDARRRVQLVRCAGRHALILTGGPQDLMLGWVPEVPPCTD